jgi:hypothetical protein
MLTASQRPLEASSDDGDAREYAREVAGTFPPLTGDQRAQLRLLLHSDNGASND